MDYVTATLFEEPEFQGNQIHLIPYAPVLIKDYSITAVCSVSLPPNATLYVFNSDVDPSLDNIDDSILTISGGNSVSNLKNLQATGFFLVESYKSLDTSNYADAELVDFNSDASEGDAPKVVTYTLESDDRLAIFLDTEDNSESEIKIFPVWNNVQRHFSIQIGNGRHSLYYYDPRVILTKIKSRRTGLYHYSSFLDFVYIGGPYRQGSAHFNLQLKKKREDGGQGPLFPVFYDFSSPAVITSCRHQPGVTNQPTSPSDYRGGKVHFPLFPKNSPWHKICWDHLNQAFPRFTARYSIVACS